LGREDLESGEKPAWRNPSVADRKVLGNWHEGAERTILVDLQRRGGPLRLESAEAAKLEKIGPARGGDGGSPSLKDVGGQNREKVILVLPEAKIRFWGQSLFHEKKRVWYWGRRNSGELKSTPWEVQDLQKKGEEGKCGTPQSGANKESYI